MIFLRFKLIKTIFNMTITKNKRKKIKRMITYDNIAFASVNVATLFLSD